MFGVQVSTAVGEGVDMFDVRQAARDALASSRPPVCLLPDSTTAEREKPMICRLGGAPIGGIRADREIVHGCLNGTYYLVTYDRPRRPGLPERAVPSAQARRCGSGDFTISSERGAQAPMSEKDAIHCRLQLWRDAMSKLRRGGGS